ncbi:MAG: helix-turn-helix domain-containing protein [Clostridia bacterium]|nr:helix-turn-helix domain-containing protein [Clostridia bacterium]
MEALKKATVELEKIIGRKIAVQREKEAVKDDAHTYFHFTFKGEKYVGALEGTDGQTAAFAALLPAHFDGLAEETRSLSKTQFFSKVLSGEGTPAFLYQYAKKFFVEDAFCFVLALETPRLTSEVKTLSAQYGDGMDVVLDTEDGRLALLHFFGKQEEVTAVAYATGLAQFIKEELGVDVQIGVGPVARSLEEAPLSYQQALGALRYGGTHDKREKVHSYKDFVLVKMLEDIPQSRLEEYYSLLSREGAREIFEDEEMLLTAKEFLRGNLNVSETARSMYLHRNTLTYRLDKIERETGLNIRVFADAVSFHVLALLYPLVKG